MALLIKQNLVMKDLWVRISNDSGKLEGYPNFSILPIDAFTSADKKLSPTSYLGAWFTADVNPDHFQLKTLSLPLLDIHVEDFNDGRVFTLSKLIRTRYRFNGELRLSGKFLLDQMAMFKACGIDSFSLPDDADYEYALFILKNTPLATY